MLNTTFCDYCNPLAVLLLSPHHLFIKNPIVPHESNSSIEDFYLFKFSGYVMSQLNY